MNEIQLSSWQTPGLTDDERGMLNELLLTWSRHYERNNLKYLYYDMKNVLHDMGIAIPPPLKTFKTVVGWPSKAVDYLAERSIFEGFKFKNGVNDELDAIMKENDFGNLYPETLPSLLIASPSFLTVTKGGPGDPEVLISAYDSRVAAGIWDYRRRCIKCGMAVVDIDEKNGYTKPTQVNLYTESQVIELYYHPNGRWTVERKSHSMGRPLMEPLRFKPTLARPFGRSRINRAVISITDSAVREALRSEVAAEFAAAPQKYVLGADDDTFDSKEKWEAYIGSIFAITSNEDGEIPHYGQLPQMSMQPHTEYMRELAARFSGETSVPMSSLGVVSDNPSSAEAMYAAKEDLVIVANNMNKVNGTALERIGAMVLATQKNVPLSELTDEDKTITASWHNPAMPSAVSQSDAIIKQVSALPWLAESDVVLEELGYSEDKIMRLRVDRERAQAREILAAAQLQVDQNAALAAQNQKAQPGNMQSMASQRPRAVTNDSAR